MSIVDKIAEEIERGEIVSLTPCDMPANTRKRYTKKQKMHHLAQKSKKGAKSNAGNELTDFQRGVNFGRAQEIGNQLGDYKYRQSDKEERAKIKEERKAHKDKAEKKRAAYFAKLDKKAEKAAAKAAAKNAKGGK